MFTLPAPGHRLRLDPLAGAIFVSMLGVGIIVPFLSVYATDLGATASMTGLIFGVFSAARLFVAPFIGPWSDKRGRKRFLVVGLVINTVTALGMLAVTTPLELLVCRVGMGFASAFTMPAALALVADLTPPGQEAKSFTGFNVGLYLGLGVGPLVGGVIYDTLGVAANFLFMAGLTLLSLYLVLRDIQDPPRRTLSGRHSTLTQFIMLKDGSVLAVFCGRAAGSMAMGFFMAFMPLLCHQKGMSNSAVGVLMAVNVLVVTVVQGPAGRFADRHSKETVALLGCVLAGAFKLALPFVDGFLALFSLSVLEGVASGFSLPALTALTVLHGKRLGAGMGEAMGLFTIALSIGVFLGPILGGWAVDGWGLAAAFVATGVFAGVGALGLALPSTSRPPA